MSQFESQPLSLDGSIDAINACVKAYKEIKATLPKDASWSAQKDNQEQARLAYLVKLPVLYDPGSFLLYIACVSHAVTIGVIDPADAGRYCHIAQTAMSAWKLFNLIVPEVEEKRRLARKKEKEEAERKAKAGENAAKHPPSNGNQSYGAGHPEVEKAIQEIIDNLPTPDVQKQFFQVLRERGHALPGDGELYRSPIAALHFIRIAKEILREEALAQYAREAKPASRPAAAPPAQPTQAA